MEEENKEEESVLKTFWIWWKKYGEHLTAPLILIALIILGVNLIKYNNLQKEVSENCGWGEDDYFCVCEKSKAIELRNNMLHKNNFSMENLGHINETPSVGE